MMVKITLLAVLLFIGYGAYYCLYDQDGGNDPITVNYALDARGEVKILNMALDFNAKGSIDICARPDAVRISLDVDCDKTGPIRFISILRLDKNIVYAILPDEGVYAVEKFELAPESQTVPPKEKQHKWYDLFEEKVDAKWIGENGERYFARRHVPRKIEELPQHLPTPKWILWVSKNLPEAKFDMWFTADTRLGSHYVDGMNKLLRIVENDESRSRFLWLALPEDGDDKRPQMAAKSCPYFPVPLRIQAGSNCKETGTFALVIEAKHFSRKKIAPSEFEPPSDCKEISIEEFEMKLYEKNPILGMILKDK